MKNKTTYEAEVLISDDRGVGIFIDLQFYQSQLTIFTEVEKMACTWFGEICYYCS